MSFEQKRDQLVEYLISEGRIYTEPVIAAMRAVPREVFVPGSQKTSSYKDMPLSIGKGQTISAPHMVGIMAEALELKPGHMVLEIGAGSGYHAAVVGQLIKPDGHLFSIERIGALASSARDNLQGTGLGVNVTVIEGDGSLGYPDKAPFDRIFVTCASPGVPPPLIEQLKNGGKLLIPSGSSYISDLLLLTKKDGKVKEENLGGCAFVPLKGKYGFR